VDERLVRLVKFGVFADVSARLAAAPTEIFELLAAARTVVNEERTRWAGDQFLGLAPAEGDPFTEPELLLARLGRVRPPGLKRRTRSAAAFRHVLTAARVRARFRLYVETPRSTPLFDELAVRGHLARAWRKLARFERAVRPERIETAARDEDFSGRVRAFDSRAGQDDDRFRAELDRLLNPPGTDAADRLDRADLDDLVRVRRLAWLRTLTDARLARVGPNARKWARLVRFVIEPDYRTTLAPGVRSAVDRTLVEMSRDVARLVRKRKLRDTAGLDVEDVVQDALVERLGRYSFESDLAVWLALVVANVVRSELRRLLRSGQVSLGENNPAQKRDDVPPPPPFANAPALLLDAMRERFVVVLDTFPADDRPFVQEFWRAKLETILTGRPVTLKQIGERLQGRTTRGVSEARLATRREALAPRTDRRMGVLNFVCDEAPEGVEFVEIAEHVEERDGQLEEDDYTVLPDLVGWARARRAAAPTPEVNP